MEQTLAEKLRILADAAEAGETFVLVRSSNGEGGELLITLLLRNARDWEQFEVTRIPPKPATIKVGNREINAPLLVMPEEGATYWVIYGDGVVVDVLQESTVDTYLKKIFNNANCWATKLDAEAYRDASLAVRKGEV